MSVLSAQAPQQIGVKESVEVRAGEIEVLVLDAKGEPVTDLRRDEFVLTVNGVPQKIDWILAPASSRAQTAGALEPLGDPPRTQIPPATLRRSTVFFVDDLHLDFRSRRIGLQALGIYIKKIPPDEEVALYFFQHGLKLVRRFTTDRGVIEAALQRLGKTVPVSRLLQSDEQWVARSRQTLQELSWMLRSLAGRPEPKVIVVLAGYLPVHFWELSKARTSFNFLGEVREVSRDAFLARATLLALDPSGVPVSGTESEKWGSRSAEADDALSQLASVPGDDGFVVRPEAVLASGGDAFAVIARETGGLRLTSSNRPERLLETEIERLNRRYRIGFTPEAKGLQTRRVEVRVSRPGLTIRTATGQRSLTGEALKRARFGSSLLGASTDSGDFPIRLVPKDKASGGGSAEILSLDIRMPLREVFLQQKGETLRGQVEILFAALDEDGGMSEVRSQLTEISIPKEEASGIPRSHFKTTVSLQVAGKGHILVGVRDTTTNRLGQATLEYGK